MSLVNIRLEEDAHKILRIYQAENGYPNQAKALNALIKEFGEMKK